MKKMSYLKEILIYQLDLTHLINHFFQKIYKLEVMNLEKKVKVNIKI